MDPVLLTITVVSLGVALVTSVMAWRTSQEEKRRGVARVAALTAAAAAPIAASSAETDARIAQDVTAPTAAAAPWRSPAMPDSATSDRAAFAGGGPLPAITLDESSLPACVSIHAGFLGTDAPAPETNRHQHWLAAAAAVVALVLGGFIAVRMGTHAQPAQAAQQASTPLELLSLRHEREGVNLSVAGLVRNPPSAPVVQRVSAVVFLFDQQGQFVTSAKAPIDFLKLTAGDESPFVVKVAAPQTVARYRVSFRTDDGTLPHVDRRGAPPVTAPVALTRQ